MKGKFCKKIEQIRITYSYFYLISFQFSTSSRVRKLLTLLKALDMNDYFSFQSFTLIDERFRIRRDNYRSKLSIRESFKLYEFFKLIFNSLVLSS